MIPIATQLGIQNAIIAGGVVLIGGIFLWIAFKAPWFNK
jgi:hypothetical protein